ncbi:hypothetical protein D3C85_1281400 [compost metagenome]
MRGVRHEHHAFDALGQQHFGAELRVLPSGAAAPFLPAHGHVEIIEQRVRHQPGFSRRRTVMQATTGEDRQARRLGQPRCIALALQADTGRLVGAPGRIATLAPGTQHHDRIRLPTQRCPFLASQWRFTLKRPGAPLHHHRQAHEPEATDPQGKTQARQSRP